MLLIARTPTDVRRAATVQSLLPQASRVIVVVVETPYWYTAPVLSPTPAHRWRALTDLRVYRPAGSTWVVDACFDKPVPAGRTLAATARAFAGHRLDAVAAPVAALAGPGAAHWRPGDPNAAPADPGGPVPSRFGARGADLVLRTTGRDPEPWEGEETPVERPLAELVSWERLGLPGGDEIFRSGLGGLSDPAACRRWTTVRSTPWASSPCPPAAWPTSPWTRTGGRSPVRAARSPGSPPPDASPTSTSAGSGRSGVRVDWGRSHTGPVAALRVVIGLAAAGVPSSPRPCPPGRARSARS
nr:hypothetical protein GCM10020093_097180 [Planobispora longispora]